MPARNKGKPCEGEYEEYASCGNELCEPNKPSCQLGSWGEWSVCSAPCNGHMNRSRMIVQYAAGGHACSGPLKEISPCNEHADVCKNDDPVDCELSEFTEWTECSVSCDGGQRYRSRDIARAASHNGKSCSGHLRETQSCNSIPCHTPVDCRWSDWRQWTDCTVACGGGQRMRHRDIVQDAQFGGASCPLQTSIQTQPCSTQACGTPEFCKWGDWGTWGECTAACRSGAKSRSRKMIKVHGEKPDNDLVATKILEAEVIPESDDELAKLQTSLIEKAELQPSSITHFATKHMQGTTFFAAVGAFTGVRFCARSRVQGAARRRCRIRRRR